MNKRTVLTTAWVLSVMALMFGSLTFLPAILGMEAHAFSTAFEIGIVTMLVVMFSGFAIDRISPPREDHEVAGR